MLQVVAAGNLGKDATLRDGGRDRVCSFSVAAEVRGRGGKQTVWINCSIWGKRGEALAGYLKKGTKVTVIGELSTREHNGKTYLECKVSEVKMMGSGSGSRSSSPSSPPSSPSSDPREHDDPEPIGNAGADYGDSDYGGGSNDDIPF